MGKLYSVLRGTLHAVTPKMAIKWAEEFDGQPSVFCPNHAGAFGPMEMCVHFPMHETCHPWMNAAMMDPKQVPAYVRQDYWWKPGSWIAPLCNATLPYLAAAIIPPVLRSVPGVPVYHDMQVIKTFRKSVEYLRKGEHLVIFPEQPDGYQSHEMKLNEGFLQIAPMVYKMLGIALKFYPVHIDYKNRVFQVGVPAQYDPTRSMEEQTPELVSMLRAGI